MLRKVLAVLALGLAVGAASSTVAQQDRIPMQYESLALDDPRVQLLWSDQQSVFPLAKEGAQVLSMELPTSNNGSFLVQVLYGGGLCGLNTCTVRIAENGVPISDFNACDDYSTHFLSLDGTKFYACDVEYDLADTVPPAGLQQQ